MPTGRGRRNYERLIGDLLVLTTILQTHWGKVSGRSACTEQELSRAEFVADQLITVRGEKDSPKPELAAALDTRSRVFTLLSRAYAEVRSAVQYLRRNHGDATFIAPALSAHKKRKPRKPGAVESEAAGQGSPPQVSETRSLAPLAEPAVENGPGHDAAESVSTEKIGIGLPGSDPFIR